MCRFVLIHQSERIEEEVRPVVSQQQLCECPQGS